MEEIKEGYTRVSTILAQWNHLAHIDKDVLANKCRIGTNVHEKIRGEIEGYFIDTLSDEEKYVESWKEWKEKKSSLSFVHAEKRFYCDDLKITGCLDAIVEQKKSSKFIVVDWKTSASVNHFSWSLQAGFYHYLAKKMGWDLENKVYFVKLKKNGRAATTYVYTITENLWEACLGAYRTYHHAPIHYRL